MSAELDDVDDLGADVRQIGDDPDETAIIMPAQGLRGQRWFWRLQFVARGVLVSTSLVLGTLGAIYLLPVGAPGPVGQLFEKVGSAPMPDPVAGFYGPTFVALYFVAMLVFLGVGGLVPLLRALFYAQSSRIVVVRYRDERYLLPVEALDRWLDRLADVELAEEVSR